MPANVSGRWVTIWTYEELDPGYYIRDERCDRLYYFDWSTLVVLRNISSCPPPEPESPHQSTESSPPVTLEEWASFAKFYPPSLVTDVYNEVPGLGIYLCENSFPLPFLKNRRPVSTKRPIPIATSDESPLHWSGCWGLYYSSLAAVHGTVRLIPSQMPGLPSLDRQVVSSTKTIISSPI
jgi:hypothetical protein